MSAFARLFGWMLAALLSTTLVAGCGGGGGGDGDGNSSGGAIIRASLATVTEQNAITIAGEAWLAVGVGFELDLPFLEEDPTSLSCDNAPDGTLDVRQGETTLTYEFDNCAFSAVGITLTGSMTVELISSSEDADGWSVTARVTFTRLVVDDGNIVTILNGPFTGTTTTTDNEVTFDISVTGDLVDWTVDGDDFAMFDFTFTMHENTATSGYGYTAQAEIQGTALGGRVVIETLTPFASIGTAFPYEGSIKVNGADGSSVTITALDDEHVRLEVVDDSGATFTIDTTWDALINPPPLPFLGQG